MHVSDSRELAVSIDQGSGGRPQFTLRTALLAVLIVAVAFGWYKSVIEAHRENERLAERLRRAQSEIENAKRRAQWTQTPRTKMSGKGRLSAVCLDGVNLRGITISGGTFQMASFKNCDLRGTTLIGGGSSFQCAEFDGADLRDATLTGAGASFQMASFAGADLSGAVVTGNLQVASFAGAKLIGARIVASSVVDFQNVNIDGAQFQGADLSTIDVNSLQGCYFYTPPVYDKKTLFPSGFNPRAQGWVLAK